MRYLKITHVQQILIKYFEYRSTDKILNKIFSLKILLFFCNHVDSFYLQWPELQH